MKISLRVRQCSSLSVLLSTSILLLSCGTTPAPTALPPTVSQNSPPAATIPAQNTTPEPLPAAISDALEKTKNINRVRYEIQVNASFADNGAATQQPPVITQGEENGADRHLVIQGMHSANGELLPYEAITVGQVTYIKGLNGISGVDPNTWYRFTAELGNITRDAPTVKKQLAELQNDEFKRGQFQSTGKETLDNLECTIWASQNEKLAPAFLGVNDDPELAAQVQVLDNSELQIWTCADGYVHRVHAALQGHNKKNSAHQSGVQVNFRIYDQNGKIAITAPSGAQDFQLPSTETTPTP
jgi:hypothetical protein